MVRRRSTTRKRPKLGNLKRVIETELKKELVGNAKRIAGRIISKAKLKGYKGIRFLD